MFSFHGAAASLNIAMSLRARSKQTCAIRGMLGQGMHERVSFTDTECKQTLAHGCINRACSTPIHAIVAFLLEYRGTS